MKALKITLLLAVFAFTFSAISAKDAKEEKVVEYEKIDKYEVDLYVHGSPSKGKPGNGIL